MPAVGGSAGSYRALIITPDMVPPPAEEWDARAEFYRSGATTWDGIHQQIVRDNAEFREAAQSTGFDAAHEAGAKVAEEAKTISEWHDGVAKKCDGIATVLRETSAGQDQLVRDADAAISSAKLPGEREALQLTYHTQARVQTGWGVEAAMALHTSFKKSAENTRAMSLLTKWGDLPGSPSADPLDNKSPGISQDEDPYSHTAKPDLRDEKAHPAPELLGDGKPATQSGIGGGEGTAAPGVVGTPPTQSPVAGSPRQASPLGSGLSSMPSGGGMPGGGGGMSSGGMPGGLGGGGLRGLSGNPLSGGLGELPGSASGLSGPAGGVSGAGSPAAAFSRGMNTGGAIGGGLPSPPPSMPSGASPALSPGTAMPSVPAAGSGGGAAPVSAQPGMVSPAAPAAPAAPAGTGTGMGAGAPMMLPPGGMGPPASAVPPPSAVTMPASAVGAGNVPSTSVPASPGGAGATLIPASVVAAGQTAAARERRESADAAAAKELAWKLQHASLCVSYNAIDWAVGVFRSPSGTETVITSNDGASYIPYGVYVPRSARLLASDPLVDEHFRQLWFGWNDPARVLVEYARLRADSGWRLVAAATTGAVTALRDEGVEHPPTCSRETNPLLRGERPVTPPTLDGMHVHRLSLVWPDVYPRLLTVMDAQSVYQERIVNAVTALMLNAATTQTMAVQGGIPDSFRRIWLSRGGGPEPNAQEWAAYDAEVSTFNMLVAMSRPGFMGAGDPRETVDEQRIYEAHWLVARTAEHVGGWARRPLPLPDMCYAALTLGRSGIRELMEEALVSVEEDLRV